MVRIVVVHDRISQDSCSVLDSEVFAVDKCSTEKLEPQSCMPQLIFGLSAAGLLQG